MSPRAVTTPQFKDHFSRLAAQYSAFRPTYPAALFDYLASLCGERRLAWDCACGSGQATLAIAERFDSVVGTDASEQQIAAAPAHPRVLYRAAPAENSGLDSGSVDLVTVAQALHWFDLASFYREVERVLRGSGVLAVWTYGVFHVQGTEIDTLIQEFYHHTVGPYWPSERRNVEDGYRSLPFPFVELGPPAFDMDQMWTLDHVLGYLRSWSATGRYAAKTGVDPVVEVGERLSGLWGDPQAPRRATWPLSIRVGRKPVSDVGP